MCLCTHGEAIYGGVVVSLRGGWGVERMKTARSPLDPNMKAVRVQRVRGL